MARAPHSSSLVENLNSRLRNCFTLRRHLGSPYLDLLRFFLNHRCYTRRQLAERVGKSPTGINDRRTPFALANPAGPRTAAIPARLSRGGRPPTRHRTAADRVRPSTAGCFRAPVCYPKVAKNEPRPLEPSSPPCSRRNRRAIASSIPLLPPLIRRYPFEIREATFFRPARSGSALGGSKRVTAIDYLARHFRVQRLRNRGGLLAADQAIGKQASDERDTSGDYRC